MRFARAPLGLAAALAACSTAAPPPAPPGPPTTTAAPLAATAKLAPVTAAASTPAAATATTPATASARCEPLHPELPSIASGPGEPPPEPLQDFGTGTLDPFYEHVAAVLRGTATDHVRIGVYGDSNMTMDFITGRMRRVLQERHGDAGHGFVAAGQPWSHYRHMDVVHGTRGGVQPYACSTDPTGDRSYGLGCIVVEAGSGGRSFFATAEAGAPVGRSVDRFDVFYVKRKGYGSFEARVDGVTRATVDTAAAADELGFLRIEVDDGPHRLELVATTAARVRLVGAALERTGKPSFVVDSFGVGSLNTQAQSRRSPELNRQMYARRPYDLLVYMTGANDIFTLDVTPSLLGEMIAADRRALPQVAVLLVTPADRGAGVSFPKTLEAVEQRRALARANETALWDMWQAMGGMSSMSRFRLRDLSIEDATHFNEKGGAWIADRLVYALWQGLARYLEAHPRAGCERAAAP
ncbi:MAG: hypothetical protein IT373_26740 [Polyangiaceae bacterium]|nr:hypothetical protein [Polyangiaceae bacterium]